MCLFSLWKQIKMSTGSKQNVYLLVSNHSSLKGCWEQYIITKRTFNFTEDFKLNLSSSIVPNEINIIIEEFNQDLVSYMAFVKKSFPKTMFILYVTEYLTPSLIFGFQLNTFSLREKILHSYISFLSSIGLTDRYTGSIKTNSKRSLIQKIINKPKIILSKISVFPIFKFYGSDAFWNTLMLTRRERALNKAKYLFSLCISTTEAVLNSYDRFCNSKLAYLPVFIDLDKSINARNGREYIKSSFFSGRVSNYRKTVIEALLKAENAYPLKKLGQHSSLKTNTACPNQNKLYLDAQKKLMDSKFLDSKNCNDYLNPSFSYFESINQVDKKDITPVFEIYIPQLKSWPYSSPNRTMLSIEKGYIPINLGTFDDHDINKYTIEFNDIYIMQSHITSINIDSSFEELDNKIKAYNEEQADKFIDFMEIFNSVI